MEELEVQVLPNRQTLPGVDNDRTYCVEFKPKSTYTVSFTSSDIVDEIKDWFEGRDVIRWDVIQVVKKGKDVKGTWEEDCVGPRLFWRRFEEGGREEHEWINEVRTFGGRGR